MIEEISAAKLKEMKDEDPNLQLIDVRQPDEHNFARIEGAKLIPLGEIVQRMNELDPQRLAVIQCKVGGRSAKAIEALRAAGYEGPLVNLKGGITAWSNDVDPKVPKY